MKQSQLFTKTRREAPTDETSRNAQLLIRGGYIHKEMAGVYTLLPLGLKVFNNIVQIIREEMNAVGGQELSMTALQDSEVWKKTNRWTDNPDVDVWFTTKLKNDTELGLGFTHEEPITRIASQYVNSYRDLPFAAYQFQTKFRNETRAKSGIMRTREFVMKDMYTFCADQKQQDEYYEKIKQAYIKIFQRVGLGDKTYVTFASGGVFSKYSHEFQTLTDAGEDEIYISDEKKIAINKEVLNDEVLSDLGLKREDLRVEKAVEVGNIFNLGTRFSEKLDLKYKNEAGQELSVIMGSYGIGPARAMGTIVEVMSDDAGIVWPASVAPFALHMVTLFKDKNEEAYKVSEEIYNKLKQSGVEVLWDDRESGAGEKFADADLLGMPMRVTISHKSLLAGGVELKERRERDNSKAEIISVEHLLTMYTKEC